jgi:hypothetical protein
MANGHNVFRLSCLWVWTHGFLFSKGVGDSHPVFKHWCTFCFEKPALLFGASSVHRIVSELSQVVCLCLLLCNGGGPSWPWIGATLMASSDGAVRLKADMNNLQIFQIYNMFKSVPFGELENGIYLD